MTNRFRDTLDRNLDGLIKRLKQRMSAPPEFKTRLVRKWPEPMPETRDTCAACGKQIPALPIEDALCVRCRYPVKLPKACASAPEKTPLEPLVIVRPESSDTIAEIFTIFHSFNFPIPESIRLKAVPELELLLDDVGDRHSVELSNAVGEFLRMMVADATPLQAGQRVIVLAYLAGKTEAKTQRDLAQLLNVSPGRVTQIMQAIPSVLQSLCRLKGRQAKPHGLLGKN